MVRAEGDMPAMKRAWSVLVLALTAVAVPAGARERVVHLKVGPFRIEAHRDREVCQAVRIPHARGLDVVTYETRSRTARDVGTHHFNTGRKAAHGLVKLILRLAPADASKRALHMLLEGTASRYIMVPPGDTRTVTATWQADGAPNEIAESGFNPAGDVCVLYLTG